MKERRIRVTILGGIVAVALVILFARAMCWQEGVALWHKIFVASICILGVTIMPFVVYKSAAINEAINCCIDNVNKILCWVKDNHKRCSIEVVIYLLLIIMVLVVDNYAVGKFLGVTNHFRQTFVGASVTVIYLLIRCYKVLQHKVELMFALVALILGLGTIFASPRTVGITWDDEEHYGRAISLASVFDFVKYDAYEIALSRVYYTRITDYSADELDAYSAELEDNYGENHARLADVLNREDTVGYDTRLGSYDIAYVAPAVAIIIARGLGLSYSGVFVAGKIGILLAYIAIIYFAIKRVKAGKMLMAVIALSPTALLLASTYSYDWWVTAWIIAGYSYYIAEMQRPDRVMKTSDLTKMCLCFIIGVVPKWIYIILAFPILFIPKNKFESSRVRGIYYAVIALSVCAVILWLILPAVKGDLGPGDSRGGEWIIPSLQLHGIYESPMRYMKVLVPSMISYLHPKNVTMYLSEYAYLGQSNLGYIVGGTILATAFIDGTSDGKRKMSSRMLCLVSVFGLISAVMTIFYLIYTPIYQIWINGLPT